MATRRSHKARLGVWMNGVQAAWWEQADDGESLSYLDAWIRDDRGRPLSLSLPFQAGNRPYKGAVVTDYFDNLLPDSSHMRRRLAQRYQTAADTPFALLTVLGRDCVGAIQLLPPDETPTDVHGIEGRRLNEAGIATLIRNAASASPLGQHDVEADLRLSIAGAQEKTALLKHEGRWVLPHGSTPTTHIFKLPLGLVGNMQADMRTSVENEWLCSKLVAAFGLPVAHCDIAQFEDQKVIVVTRFDRELSQDGAWIARIPQEDMCQATGTPALKKYQVDGGPGISRIMSLLDGSQNREQDRNYFFKAQIVFWLLAATDGHAKNFSLRLLPQGAYRSTPLYDVLSAHPILGAKKNQIAPQKAKLAMAVRSSSNHYRIADIRRRQWLAQGHAVGMGSDVIEMIDAVVADTDCVIEEVQKIVPKNFPQDVAEAIFEGMTKQARVLAQG